MFELADKGAHFVFIQASARQKKKQTDSDFKYDVIGWVVMIGIAVAWLGVAASKAAPTPSSTPALR